MRLEDSIDKNTYLSKEKELKFKLDEIEKQRIDLIEVNDKNKHISENIKQIEKILNNYLKPIKKFSRDSFEELVEKIIVGAIDEDGSKRPNIVRFILRTGVEYKTIIDKNNKGKNNNSNQDVSFVEK